jgi:hypothetical protein
VIDTTTLHRRIALGAPGYVRELFADEARPSGTDQWRIGRKGSLSISIKDGTLVYFCHESGSGGDAVALWQRQRGGTMGEALQAAAGWANLSDEGTPAGPSRRRAAPRRKAEPGPETAPAPAPEPLSTEQRAQAFAMSRRLAGDDALCARIAARRGWLPETVRGLALDGCLGWSDRWAVDGYQWHRGALAFIYTTGIKLRWKRGEERMIRWALGKPAALWRGCEITRETSRVYVTEGETDALFLLDSGAESSPGAVVVALPSAGVMPWGLADRLAGREVVLCLDNDDAGRRATAKITAAIGSRVATLREWREER